MDSRNVFLVTELCSGGELLDLVRSLPRWGEREARAVVHRWRLYQRLY
jgi:hypothetical protein